MSFIEPIKVLADIIKTEMSLADDRVLIYNQKWNLPNDSDIFISLRSGPTKTFSNRNNYEDRESGFYEVQDINIQENIIIDIFSKDDTARTRKEEIIMALKSTYSQQNQEINSIKIAEIPNSFIDVSEAEASAMLNRYNITIRILSWRTKEKTVDYYDKYDYDVVTN